MDGAEYGRSMAVSAPLTRGWHGYSAVSLEISITAQHYCHACPDLSLSGRCTVPTTAYLYGPEMAGPAR